MADYTEHAILPPSAAHRWMLCPGSVALSEKAQAILGPERQSPAAAQGTALHEAAEQILRNDWRVSKVIGKTYNGVEITKDMIDRIEPYIQLVRSLDGVKFYEYKVVFLADWSWGTIDCAVIHKQRGKWRLVVIDLKTGTGYAVDAENNYQILIYAIAVYDQLKLLYDIDYVDMVISQPTRDDPDTWTLEPEELEVYRQDILKGIRRVQQQPKTYIAGEAQCRWCRAKAICPALGEVVEQTRQDDYAIMTAANISQSLDLVPMVKEWIKGVEEFAKELMLMNKPVPDYKLVEGRKSRAWKNEGGIIAYLSKKIKNFNVVGYSTPKLKSPHQIELLIKELKARVDLTDHIVVNPGPPTLVKESDSRPAMTPGSRAAEDFAHID